MFKSRFKHVMDRDPIPLFLLELLYQPLEYMRSEQGQVLYVILNLDVTHFVLLQTILARRLMDDIEHLRNLFVVEDLDRNMRIRPEYWKRYKDCNGDKNKRIETFYDIEF